MEFDTDYAILELTSMEFEALNLKVRILITTVNSIETEAFFRFLLPVPEKDAILSVYHKTSTYTIGRLGRYLVAHVQTEKGAVHSNGSALTINDGISLFKSFAVIAVGVGFGLKPKVQVYGDVLISEEIVEFDSIRVVPEKEKPSTKASYRQAGPLLIDRFTKVSVRNWKCKIGRKRFSTIYAGQVLTSEKLVDNIEFVENLRSTYPRAVGGEMEGAGIAAACYRNNIANWIIIKGISDWADGSKTHKAQSMAANAAMSLLFHVLAIKGSLDSLDIDSYSTEIIAKETDKYTINARIGTPLWTLNRIRSAALPALLTDLLNCVDDGYPEEVCIAVRRDLSVFLEEVSSLPNLYDYRKALETMVTKFNEKYSQWNSAANSEERNQHYHSLREIRDEIADLFRENQKQIGSQSAMIDTANLLEAHRLLIKKYGDIFRNLRRVTRKIDRKGKFSRP